MSRTLVGLDVGSTAVRVVELKAGRRASLVHAGAVELPSGAVEAGTVKNPGAVTEALRELWQGTKVGNRSVRLGVGSSSVLVRQLELDWMAPADLRKALRYQVADLLPVSVDDANIDHVPLGEVERTDPQTGATRRCVRILLVATARGAVDELVRSVQAAGLRPVTADLAALGLVRAAARVAQVERSEPQTEAVVDIGADKIAVAVHTGGSPQFVRVVPGVGGAMLTRALVERTGRSWEDAERFKRECTIPLQSPSLVAVGAGEPPGPDDVPTSEGRHLAVDDHASRIVLMAARQLIAEVRATLDFHASTEPDRLPTRVLLTGGGSYLGGLVELARVGLDLPALRLEPGAVLPRLNGRRGARGLVAEDASLVVPLGLALKEAS